MLLRWLIALLAFGIPTEGMLPCRHTLYGLHQSTYPMVHFQQKISDCAFAKSHTGSEIE